MPTGKITHIKWLSFRTVFRINAQNFSPNQAWISSLSSFDFFNESNYNNPAILNLKLQAAGR